MLGHERHCGYDLERIIDRHLRRLTQSRITAIDFVDAKHICDK